MKTIDMLAEACAPKVEQQTGGAPDLSTLSNDVIDRIADAVISKLSTAQAPKEADHGPDPDPEPETESDADAEGGEMDE